MIRFLIRLVIWFLAALIGIMAADLLLSGFKVSGITSYLTVALIYAIVQSVMHPILESISKKRAAMFSGGMGIISAAVALLVTNLISGALSIDGIGTWLGAAIIVWLFGALALFILPFVIAKNVVEDARDNRR